MALAWSLKGASLPPTCKCLGGVRCKQALIVLHWEAILACKLPCSCSHEHAVFSALHHTSRYGQGSRETAQGGRGGGLGGEGWWWVGRGGVVVGWEGRGGGGLGGEGWWWVGRGGVVEGIVES